MTRDEHRVEQDGCSLRTFHRVCAVIHGAAVVRLELVALDRALVMIQATGPVRHFVLAFEDIGAVFFFHYLVEGRVTAAEDGLPGGVIEEFVIQMIVCRDEGVMW